MHLGRDFDGMRRGVEAADRPDAAVAVQASGPERIFADAVGGDNAQSRDDHSAHARVYLTEMGSTETFGVVSGANSADPAGPFKGERAVPFFVALPPFVNAINGTYFLY